MIHQMIESEKRILHVTTSTQYVDNFDVECKASESANDVLTRWRADGYLWVGKRCIPWHIVADVELRNAP